MAKDPKNGGPSNIYISHGVQGVKNLEKWAGHKSKGGKRFVRYSELPVRDLEEEEEEYNSEATMVERDIEEFE